MIKKISPITIVALILLLIAIVATRRDFSKRNLRFFPGMVYATSYRAQSDNPVFPDGKTNQPPVPGTIPRGFNPYPYKDTVDDRQISGWKLKNPYPPTPDVLARGKEVFNNFCSHCHGLQGYGDGPVAQRSLLAMSLLDTVTKERPDGMIFHIITYGRLYMPPHASLISQQDRWKVIRYLRELQKATETP